ncbi:MAG: glycosyl hydrolase 115 family protein [Rhizomicrobium sp.]|nr:glycosyl hydrolase 115 family protein [Rhizomicrobium sp.]
MKTAALITWLCIGFYASLAPAAAAAPGLLPFAHFVTEKAQGFALVRARGAAPIFVDKDDHKGVVRAAGDLQADIARVTGIKPQLSTGVPTGAFVVMVGTIGKSTLIDALVKSGKIKADAIRGQWEAFVVATVSHPCPGVEQALVIAGSDKRGTIYGIYELSEQIGVSPWYWFADVPAKQRKTLSVLNGSYVQGPPAVKYRGIFIKDEAPAFTGWAKAKFGGLNSKMYTHVFELILRLRGNYLWPAMWDNAFNEDDAENPRLADEYGVVMGTSHHEPMMRSHHEWLSRKDHLGNGEWNYASNKAAIQGFFREGIDNARNYDNLVTMGMRGDGDVAMASQGDIHKDVAQLESIIADQRQILRDELHKEPAEVPQLWALFTEVLKYYDAGMKVPDDITLLFTDDNVGDIRRLPTAAEAKRPGGAGIYYHMDMHGGPYAYQWLNTNPLPKVWEQMDLAYQYGADRIWITNIGDIKPLEVPIEFFLRLGYWGPKTINKDTIAAWTKTWAARDFGSEHADEIADIVAKYGKYNGWRKPEQVRADTYSLIHDREAERVSAAWNDIATRAEAVGKKLPPEAQDAYYQLVLYPVKASANLVDTYIAAGRNQLFAAQGRASTNAEAVTVRELFAKDRQMSEFYNKKMAGGKWDHMMDQTHFGYTDWYPPLADVSPAVSQVIPAQTSEFAVALEGRVQFWPGYYLPPALAPLDSLSKRKTFIEVYPVGTKPIAFTSRADQPWITLSEGKAFSAGKDDRRIWIDIDWEKASIGMNNGFVIVKGTQGEVRVRVTAIKATREQEKDAKCAFGGLTGPIAIAASEASKNTAVNGVSWQPIPDYGRAAAGMAIFPVTAPSFLPGQPAPRLEYEVYFAKPGTYQVDIVTSPTLDFHADNNLGLAVSLDGQAPDIRYVFTAQSRESETFLGKAFYENAKNNARTMHFTVKADKAGRHSLKLAMIDPGLVLQKIIVHDDELPASYFGPLDSARNGDETCVLRKIPRRQP